MEKYKTINGWTKARMLKVISKRKSKARAYGRAEEYCMYETRDGNRCAVGLFIPDGHEGLKHRGPVESLLRRFSSLGEAMPLEPTSMKVFQKVHDHRDRGDVKAAMRDWVLENVEDDTNEVSS